MRYRIAGSYNEEGRWRGAGLLYESQPGRLLFVTPRDHGRVLEADMDAVDPTAHLPLQGLELTEARELDFNFSAISSERFLTLLRQGPQGATRRRKRRQRPQIDVRAYEERDESGPEAPSPPGLSGN